MRFDEKDFIAELRGNRRCLIEGVSGLLEYGDTAVAAELGKATITIRGKRLRLSMMSEDRLGICGEIDSITLEERNDK